MLMFPLLLNNAISLLQRIKFKVPAWDLFLVLWAPKENILIGIIPK